MKIMVTGASGFIGRWLVQELVEQGHTVFGLDLEEFPLGFQRPDVHVRGDVLAGDTFTRMLSNYGPQVVVHLAAQVGRLFGEDDVLHAVKSNAGMTAKVAKAAGDHGVRVVYASTSEVYGDQGDTPVDEFDGPFTLPHNIYGLSKRWGEEIIMLYAPQRAQFLRLSMPYGPGAPPGRGRRALDNFLWQAWHRMPIPVHEDSKRSWCWIGDTVRGIRLIIEEGEPGPYNVGRDDDEVTMEFCAREACALAGAPKDLIEMIPAPGRQTVVKRLKTDRLRGMGWEPMVPLYEGMVHVFEWIKQFDAEGRSLSVPAAETLR